MPADIHILQTKPSPLELALGWIKRGWNPVPVSQKTKKPFEKNWQKRWFGSDDAPPVEQVFCRSDINVGVQMGPFSHGLTDVDLDCAEALIAGARLLPRSNNIFGRKSKSRSHWLYNTDLAAKVNKAALQFKDPVSGKMMLELRIGGGGKGAQSVFPGSTHESGEPIRWDEDGMLVTVDGDELRRAIERIAVVCLLARHWPDEGGRHDAALTVGGFLARAGFELNEVETLVSTIAETAFDQEVEDRARAARDAAAEYAADRPTRGLPTMMDLFGENVARSAAKWLHYTGKADAERQQPDEADSRPIIYSVDGQLPYITDAIHSALLASPLPVLVQGGKLVRPLWADYPVVGRPDARTRVSAFSPYDIAVLRCDAGRVIAFKKWNADAGDWVPTNAPVDACAALLAQGQWQFPRVAGIVNCPTLRPDGSLLHMTERGYDPATRLWVEPDPTLRLPAIPEAPTREDAEDALDLLDELLSGFAFVSKLVDQGAALSALMTPVIRGAYVFVPLFMIRAPEAGTGKSYLAHLVSTIARGLPCPALPASKNEEEMEKRLSSVLLEGAPLISLDNLDFDIGGSLINQIVSEPIIKPRILGVSRAPDCEWRGTLMANGNNVTVMSDLVRRTILINMDAVEERPELRRFEFDPIERVLSDRGRYIAAIITIVRAYLAAGCPMKDEVAPLNGFRGWCRFVREPLIWLRCGDPVKSQEQLRREDPMRSTNHALVAEWRRVIGEGVPVKTSEIIAVANQPRTVSYNQDADPLSGSPYANDELRVVLLERAATSSRRDIDPRRLGYWLRSIKNKVVKDDGGRWRLRAVTESEGHGNTWVLERVPD